MFQKTSKTVLLNLFIYHSVLHYFALFDCFCLDVQFHFNVEQMKSYTIFKRNMDHKIYCALNKCESIYASPCHLIVSLFSEGGADDKVSLYNLRGV